jgi:hypothetical protein
VFLHRARPGAAPGLVSQPLTVPAA